MTNITESEMNSAWSTFDAMRNAVIEGSKLREDVDKLTAQVQAMQVELSRNTEYAKNLEETVASMRKSRDDALADASALRASHREKDSMVAHLTSENDRLTRELQSARARAEGLQQERDHAIQESLDWEEKANSFRAVVDGIREKLSALGMSLPVHPKEDEVQPQPTPSEPQVAAPEVAATVPPIESSTDGGSSQAGDGGGVDSEGRPQQPRDPQTQQWRSPYNEI